MAYPWVSPCIASSGGARPDYFLPESLSSSPYGHIACLSRVYGSYLAPQGVEGGAAGVMSSVLYNRCTLQSMATAIILKALLCRAGTKVLYSAACHCRRECKVRRQQLHAVESSSPDSRQGSKRFPSGEVSELVLDLTEQNAIMRFHFLDQLRRCKIYPALFLGPNIRAYITIACNGGASYPAVSIG